MKNIILFLKNKCVKLRNMIYSSIYWKVEFYQINNKKIDEAKIWINNYLNKLCLKENIKVTHTNYIKKENDIITAGTYNILKKEISLLNDNTLFSKELTWLHELGHHFSKKADIGNSEAEADLISLVIIKDFPKWIIQTISISIQARYNISEDKVKEMYDLSIYNIKKSERREYAYK